MELLLVLLILIVQHLLLPVGVVATLGLDVVHLFGLVHADFLQVLFAGSLVFEDLVEHLVDVDGHLKEAVALGARLLLWLR